MCLLVESVRISGNRPQNLLYHTERANRSRRELFGRKDSIDLRDWIHIPDSLDSALTYKFRVVYNETFQTSDVKEYHRREVESLKIVNSDSIDYHVKYEDKSRFQPLLDLKGNCDDILIIRNGLITDTSFSNIAFYDGTDWITPAQPLLEGTMRAKLIAESVLRVEDLRISDLKRFQKISLINAMLDLGDTVLPAGNVEQGQE